MQSKMSRFLMPAFVILSLVLSACNLSAETVVPAPTLTEAPLIPVAAQLSTATPTTQPTEIPATATASVSHAMTPADPPAGKIVYDVESSGTAPEKRAPYGDSYEWNRLERPFQQDMAYVPDLDIVNFTVSKDNDWWYVRIEIVRIDPGSPLEINYGVELDLDHDGYGDYILWAHPPYTDQWETLPVQIYQDNSHNTGGLSAGKTDAPFKADGYETLIFDGSAGGSDPDVAWVRVNPGSPASVQFAFKRSWSGSVFMLGVIADAGWKDPQKLDYVDRLTIAEAGSPVKDNMYYPLKGLVLVDNTCRDAFGFEPTHFEPQICPVIVAPSKTPDPSEPEPGQVVLCPPPTSFRCPNGWDYVNCRCH